MFCETSPSQFASLHPWSELLGSVSIVLDSSDVTVLAFGPLACCMSLLEKSHLYIHFQNSVNMKEVQGTWGLLLFLLIYVVQSPGDFQLTIPNLFLRN